MSVLTHKSFSIIPQEAAKEAYLLNLVQGIGDKDRLRAGEILVEYAIGEMSYAEAERELESWTAEIAATAPAA